MSEEFNKNNQGFRDGQLKEPKKRLKVKKRVVESAYGGYGAYSPYSTYTPKEGYSGYSGYNSQYQQGGEMIPNRTIKDYWLILKERMAWVLVTFIVVFLSVVLYTWRVTPTYESTVRLQILRDSGTDKSVIGDIDRASVIQNAEDFNTQVKILDSQEVVRNVLSRMKGEEKKELMSPYEDTFSFMPKLTEVEIVAKNRRIMPERNSLVVLVSYSHPMPEIAMRMADLFAQEYINFTQDVRVQKLLEEQSALKLKVDLQDDRVKLLDQKLVDYRQQHGAGSLDLTADVDTRELMDLNAIVTANKKQLDVSQTNWLQLQDFKDNNKDFQDLYFVATLPQVNALLTDKTQQQIAISALAKRYKDKHPQMIAATKRFEQTERELEVALNSAYQKIKASHESLQRNYDLSLQDLEAKKNEIIELKKLAVEYNSILREKREEEALLSALISAYTRKTNEIYLIRPTAQTIDSAGLPTRPSSPNYVLNIAIGFIGALVAGIGIAFAVAFMDDRVKSSYDIEYAIGLPLLGVLPRVKRLNSNQKAQLIASNANRYVTESFRSLYSSIGVSPLANGAKLFLSTSTTPSEGKSFVMTNLAYTAAMNGDRVILIDADLRLPSIAKNLDIKSDKGIMSCVENGMPLDEAIIKDVFPNVDLLICERRASNPMQILNSQAFMDMLEELKSRYDKVYIDTPPVGVVSDVMSIFPLVDAVMYVVKYNSVKRGLIKANVKRMLDANMPIMGIVMNMVTMSSSSDYGAMYNKKYQTYYTSDE